MYQYEATLIKVVDGDTVDLCVDLGFDIKFNMRVRLNGIDTPELNSPDPGQRILATLAKDHLANLLSKAVVLTVNTHKDKKEKYGRYLADIMADGVDVVKDMLDTQHGVPYTGGKRP
jgi:micrococcal nuclease